MHLNSIELTNYRSYDKNKFTFHPHYNFIVGQNGRGKTNLIEAIYYLSFLKSFRTSDKRDLLKDQTKITQIAASLLRQDLSYDILITFDENQKRILRLNGKNPKLYEDYYGLVPVLLFEPRDVYLFRETPSLRRKYINRALFLDNPLVLKKQLSYEKIIEQRNHLLKEPMVGPADMEIWNLKMAALGSEIIYERLGWISRLSEFIKQEWHALTGSKKMIDLGYSCSFLKDTLTTDMIQMSLADIQKHFMNAFAPLWPQEKRRRESLIGPHRDDWWIQLNEEPVGTRGSQGENRLVLLALKGAQLSLFEQEHAFSPLFILDDVMSELDTNHAERLITSLKERGGQVFLTTTDLNQIPLAQSGDGARFILE